MEMINCSHCQKEVEKSKVIYSKIIYRDREMKWDSWKKRYISKAVVKSKIMPFCSGNCASHHQMGMEG